VFVPVGINYDRVIEDRNLTAATAEQAGAPYAQRGAFAFTAYVARALALAVAGRWYRNGYASVSFGTPLSMRAYTRARHLDFRKLTEEQHFAAVEVLGKLLMSEVGKIIPVLPVSLVATVLLGADRRALTHDEVKSAAATLIGQIEANGGYVHMPRQDLDYAVRVGLRMLRLRRMVDETGGRYVANPREQVLLRYYANAIAHHLDPAAAAG